MNLLAWISTILVIIYLVLIYFDYLIVGLLIGALAVIFAIADRFNEIENDKQSKGNKNEID